jgi:bifunctional UDP-N-acetylglucosamine pyrophosphorylase/glucosamine-1-phosphate N-acetyltransferase
MMSGLAGPAEAVSDASLRRSTTSRIPGLGAIVMAAGQGTRMRSKLVKVLHPVAGRPMILYALELAERCAGDAVVVVVGYQADRVKAVIESHAAANGTGGTRDLVGREKGLTAHVKAGSKEGPRVLLAEQTQQLGTGHAIMQARLVLERLQRTPPAKFLIVNGDTPLLAETTVRELVRVHEQDGAAVTLLTAMLEHPQGYGRIVRDRDDRVMRIVEDRDATDTELRLREINAGTYVVDGRFLFEALDKLQPHNAQREYYLTDIVGLAVQSGRRVSAHVASTAEEALGVNSRQQLAAAERVVRGRLNARWMTAGVTLRDPGTTFIDADVEIGQDTVLYPNVTLEGRTRLGEDCVIHSQTRIADSVLGNRVTVQDSCVIRESRVEDDAAVGPFAHLRPGSVLRRSAKVGNFVETKKTELGEGSKANHLTYLGDAKIGKGVNIGAGTITCNYDGVHKHETVIEDDVFVGSDTQFIAPVKVGRGAVVGAGSTITTDVPADALAIARTPQVNRPGWVARRRSLPDRAQKPAASSSKARASGGGKTKKKGRR